MHFVIVEVVDSAEQVLFSGLNFKLSKRNALSAEAAIFENEPTIEPTLFKDASDIERRVIKYNLSQKDQEDAAKCRASLLRPHNGSRSASESSNMRCTCSSTSASVGGAAVAGVHTS